MCMKKTKKKLPPADVIPNEHNFSGKGCKESDCSSNKSDMKINRENEYLETELSATRIPMNTFGMPLAGPVSIPNDFRLVLHSLNVLNCIPINLYLIIHLDTLETLPTPLVIFKPQN